MNDFTPNHNRAFYLQGVIDQALVDDLTPKIVKLQAESASPITVYVDSPGGSVLASKKLFDLVTAPRLDGGRCSLIVVVTGTAASAAADFSALADYTILYPHSELLYHGARLNSEPELTVAAAQSAAEFLQWTNESYAFPLACRSFDRFIWRLWSLKDEYDAFIESPTPETFSVLIEELSKELSFVASHLVFKAIDQQQKLQDLTDQVDQHIGKLPDDIKYNEFQAEILIAILRAKLSQNPSEWSLSDGGLGVLSADFQMLHDYHFGQSTELTRLSKTYGSSFLNATEKVDFQSEEKINREAADEWLKKTTHSRLQMVWYFCVSLCRLLQEDDHQLIAKDAYWLGLADEVLGSKLPNLREMLRQKNQRPKSEKSKSAKVVADK